MDSNCAVRCIIKPGSPVPVLNAAILRLLDLCLTLHVRLLPEWTSRNNIEFVDALSKKWAGKHPLRPFATDMISAAFPEARIQNPTFTQVANTMSTAIRSPGAVVVVHPVWQGQAWWPRMVSSRSAFIPIGRYQDVLHVQPDGHPLPQWQFQASLFDE
jgi:hypothetical protein